MSCATQTSHAPQRRHCTSSSCGPKGGSSWPSRWQKGHFNGLMARLLSGDSRTSNVRAFPHTVQPAVGWGA